ncbi:CaiB/BaiF CoA transferase family protein [Woodsholea maritima]|uniref:CaiB/BaiF CoA transferase family protein n=1 Tax=Woodsholea maritima TaxID=240237 RepID=UPI00035DAC61|nr:CoA transferase [Woodsholea maritima]
MYKPLDGLRLLALEQADAGPFATQLLAGLGADIIKIEHDRSHGDHARRMGPYDLGVDDCLYFQTYNRSKRSMTLDLHDRGDRKLFHKLIESADGLVTALRGDVVDKLGLDYPRLKAYRPDLVCAHLTAYGREGPRAHWPAYSAIIQAELGLFHHQPSQDDFDLYPHGAASLDMLAGSLLANGLLAGLLAAHRQGKGCDVDITLFGAGLIQHGYQASWQLNGAQGLEAPRERAQHPSSAPSQVFQTRDGWILIMCQRPKFWAALCQALEKESWLHDLRFRNRVSRRLNAHALQEELEAVFLTGTNTQWLDVLAGKIPIAPVQSFESASHTDFVQDYIQTLDHPAMPDGLRLVQDPIAVNGQVMPAHRAPDLNGDAGEVLDDLLARPARRAATH